MDVYGWYMKVYGGLYACMLVDTAHLNPADTIAIPVHPMVVLSMPSNTSVSEDTTEETDTICNQM